MGNKSYTVLITGGTSSIGAACASRFAEGGWDVLFTYRKDEAKARALCSGLEGLGVAAECHNVDFAVPSDVDQFTRLLKQRRVDSLVNNAGSYVVQKPFDQMTWDHLQSIMSVNFSVPFLLSSAVFGPMAERGFGRIVNISSIAAKYGGSAMSMHYGCSKRALEGITLTLGREGADQNVLVNTVRPGVIDTEFHKRFPKNMNERVQMIPMKRMGKPGEVAKMVFMLGSEQNTFTTRQTITVSGGE